MFESDWIMIGIELSGLAVLIITTIKNKGFSLFAEPKFTCTLTQSIAQTVELK